MIVRHKSTVLTIFRKMNRASPKKSTARVQLQKKKLENQLEQLDRDILQAKGALFQLLNKSTPSIPTISPYVERQIAEYDKLCNYFHLDPNVFPSKEQTPKSPKSTVQPQSAPTIISEFRKQLNSLNNAEKSRQDQLDRLKKAMALLSNQQEALEKEKTRRQITLVNSLISLKSQFEDIKSIFESFYQHLLDQLNQFKTVTLNTIHEKIDHDKSKLNALQDQINDLETQKNAIIAAKQERLSKLSFQRIDDQTIEYVYEDSKLREMVRNYAVEILSLYQNRMSEFEGNFTLNLNSQFHAFNQLIDQKILKFDQIKQERKERLSRTCIHNWAVLAKALVKYSRIQLSFKELNHELKQEDSELTAQLDRERKLVHEVIPGTNLTVLDLRKEIVDLTHQLSEINQRKAAELNSIEKEHETFKRNSQKEIEKLEVQIHKM